MDSRESDDRSDIYQAVVGIFMVNVGIFVQKWELLQKLNLCTSADTYGHRIFMHRVRILM